jgi:tetratricopeptide (TPR) repeat protein
LVGLSCLFALLAVVPSARASIEQAHEDCAAAAAAYGEGDFGRAEQLYSRALEAGLDAAVVHYDLGNAKFKQGELGSAIASYLRALRLDPRDANVRTNLERARAQVKDAGLGSGELPPVLRPFQWGYARSSANEWLALGLILWVLLAGLRVLNQWRPLDPDRVRTATGFLLVFCLVCLAVGGWRYRQDFVVERGVVVAEEVEVRSGPGIGYNLAFRIHEGLPVRIAADRGDWVRIDLGGELVGWVPATALEFI